jgi:hypothetical protein
MQQQLVVETMQQPTRNTEPETERIETTTNQKYGT